MGKGENARHEQFLLFHCVFKTCTADTYKQDLFWKGVIVILILKPTCSRRGQLYTKRQTLALSKLEVFADDNLNVTKKFKFVFDRVGKYSGKSRQCWLRAFSPFPNMFSKSFFCQNQGR